MPPYPSEDTASRRAAKQPTFCATWVCGKAVSREGNLAGGKSRGWEVSLEGSLAGGKRSAALARWEEVLFSRLLWEAPLSRAPC